MSPRAAWRLESLGFGEVYEYGGGKLDWMAAGLPTEGTNAKPPNGAARRHKGRVISNALPTAPVAPLSRTFPGRLRRS